MEALNLSCKIGNNYKPTPMLAQILANKFQLNISDFQLGLICLKPIGDEIRKAQYKTILIQTECDGVVYQTEERTFSHWEEECGDGLFALSLSRYDHKRVAHVRISRKDYLLSKQLDFDRKEKGLFPKKDFKFETFEEKRKKKKVILFLDI